MLNSIRDFSSPSGTGHMTNKQRPLLLNGAVNWEAFDKMREDHPICFDHKAETISFKVMTKPANEGGSGCQLTDLIEVALHQLKFFQAKFPCRENAISITKFEEGLMWQKKRTEDRVNRGVEGTDTL
jgi:hypothetical protein